MIRIMSTRPAKLTHYYYLCQRLRAPPCPSVTVTVNNHNHSHNHNSLPSTTRSYYSYAARRGTIPTTTTLSSPSPLSSPSSSFSGRNKNNCSSTWHHHQFPIHAQYNRLQFRYFDHRKKRKTSTKKKVNPFKVLSIPEGVTLYKDAKKKFLKIAMKNHPDTIASGDNTVSDEEREKMRDTFIQARIAFESLAEDPSDGMAIMKEDLDEAMDNFDSWFKSETGLNTPFQFDMDPATMKEVASMTEKIGGGLDRDGGMWALARMVTASVKSGSGAGTPLRLEAGDVKDRVANGSLLRRRRKR